MKMNGKWFQGGVWSLLLLASDVGICGEVPEYFRLLSHQPPPLSKSALPPSAADAEWRPSAEDIRAGFALTTTGVSVNPHPRYDWTNRNPERRIRCFMAPGEVRGFWIAVRPVGKGGTIQMRATAATGENGKDICGENFLFQRCFYVEERKFWDGQNCYLVPDAQWKVEANETFWTFCSLYVPETTSPGIYRGMLDVSLEVRKVEIPVEIAVLNAPVPKPDIALGAYIPGHYLRENVGAYRNYAAPWFTPKNLDMWIRFWKSRGLNSPFLFHVYVDVEMRNGEIQLDVPFLNDLIAAMKRNGMTGPILLDMRHLSWWSCAVALRLAKTGEDPATATPGVKGSDGLSLANIGSKAYPAGSADIFRRAMKVFAARYADFKIPLLYLSEEEIGYHLIDGYFNTKTEGYETFNPVLAEVVGPERICLTDLSLGHGFPGIDRGARDHLAYREYNNWTDEAIDTAHRQGANVWLYNSGWLRSIAPYMMRVEATGFHQWADGWWDPNMRWLASAINPDGALTTLEMERLGEAMADLGYFRLLPEWEERARAAGCKEEADKLRELRRSLFGELPVNYVAFQNATSHYTDKDWDLLRWKCVEAVSEAQRALGERPLWNPGTRQTPTALVQGVNGVMQDDGSGPECVALEIVVPVVWDGQCDERIWANTVAPGAFRRPAPEDAHLRAIAASQEEFERMEGPSGSNFRVFYDNDGLYFWFGTNHATSKGSRRGDDDREIWADDVMEFFWKPLDGPEWHLIVNSKGARTLFRNGVVVPDNAVKVALHSPLNASGGVSGEIFVPWRTIECAGKPSADTVWRFNVCRNFNSWNQLSSWAQVDGFFGLSDGKLSFGGVQASGDVPVEVSRTELGVGRNCLMLKWTKPAAWSCQVRDSADRLVLREELPLGRSAQVIFPVAGDAPQGRWRLTLSTDGTEHASIPLWFDGAPALKCRRVDAEVIQGLPLEMVFDCRAGLQALAEQALTVELTSLADGKTSRLKVGETVTGENRLSVTTDGLAPGKYRLVVRLGDLPGRMEADTTILCGPFQ